MTSDLDKFFGPKLDVEMPAIQPSHFGRYPVRIRSVCDAFIDEMGWGTDPTTKRNVAAGAKRFVDVHGEKPDLVRRTIKYLERNAMHIYLNIGSPGSLINPARRFAGRSDPDSDEARQKYVWEVDDVRKP